MECSLIIPVKNEEAHIRDFLESLLSQSKKPDEIIIVDGGSTDKTTGIINEYLKNGMPIKLIEAEGSLPGMGRNIAIQNAKNDIIAMTDGGIILKEDWLEKVTGPFEKDPSIDVVYGTYTYCAKNLFEQCFAIVYMPKKRIPFLASMAIRRRVWEAAGKFREDLRATEDLLFLEKIESLKVKSFIAPDAVVMWRPRSSFNEAFTLSLKYAMCDALAGFHFSRHIRKCLMYLAGLLLIYCGFHNAWWFMVLSLGFILDMLLVCKKHFSEFAEVVKKYKKSLFIIAGIILVLDIAGLIGFMKGLFKRYLRTS